MRNIERAHWLCAIELALAFFLWHFFLWIVAPRLADAEPAWQAISFALLAFVALWVFWLSPRLNRSIPHSLRGVGPWRTFFLRKEGLGRSARNYALITMLGWLMLLGIRLARPPAALPMITWDLVALRFASYVLSGLLQSLVFFEFFQPRFRAILGERETIWGTALVFALFHFPNVPVMGLGLVACYFWAREYLHRPNLILVMLSHAVLGSSLVLVAGIIPKAGPFYLNPQKYLLRALFPWWRDLVNGLW
jgi:hypothetical protein